MTIVPAAFRTLTRFTFTAAWISFPTFQIVFEDFRYQDYGKERILERENHVLCLESLPSRESYLWLYLWAFQDLHDRKCNTSNYQALVTTSISIGQIPFRYCSVIRKEERKPLSSHCKFKCPSSMEPCQCGIFT